MLEYSAVRLRNSCRGHSTIGPLQCQEESETKITDNPRSILPQNELANSIIPVPSEFCALNSYQSINFSSGKRQVYGSIGHLVHPLPAIFLIT